MWIFKRGKKHYREYKENARAFVYQKITELNQHYQFAFGKIAIRNTRSRWGSCSKKGNLNFSYRLLFLPLAVAEYVIVHELCHLKEFNHSKNFWNLVAKAVPNHRALRKELRHHLSS